MLTPKMAGIGGKHPDCFTYSYFLTDFKFPRQQNFDSKVPNWLLLSSLESNQQFSTPCDFLKNHLCFISQYLLLNYLPPKYSFLEEIQTSLQIVDFEWFPIQRKYRTKLLNADCLRQRAFFLNHEGTLLIHISNSMIFAKIRIITY